MTWLINGNADTAQPANFLGTTNNQPLAIRTNAAVNPRDVVHITSASSINDVGFVGIGLSAPQAPLHVVAGQEDPLLQRTAIHTSGPNAGYSFNSRTRRTEDDPATPGFTQSPISGERWVWFAELQGDQHVAQLWTGGNGRLGPKLIVTPLGEMRLPGGVWQGVDFTVSVPLVNPVPGELVLGGIRTSVSGFDGPPDEPPSPGAQQGLRRGSHFIRTNGNENELWMGFRRERIPGVPLLLARSLVAAVPWFGPSFNVTSDERLKTNVRQVEGALEKLERISGVAYESAEVESPHALGGVPGEPGLGVLAQEVQEVFPELVSIYEPDQQYKAVDYQGLTSVLIEAVKELKAQNEELRSRIEALERA